MFFGRKKELDRISEKINSNKFENILLTGIKRIGKTSLLKKVSDNFEGYKIFSQLQKVDMIIILKIFEIWFLNYLMLSLI